MKTSDYIAQFFADRGINVIFGYIGGMVTHLVDSFYLHPDIKFIQTYHEQTAAIAAEGYALESGKPGVAIATSGPGATNLITGIADAWFGSIPTIYITGQVNSYEYKYEKPIRQQGFQETDVISIVKPITKYAVFVDNPENIRYELEKAYYLALNDRKGPVLIDLTMDVSRAEIEPDALKSFIPKEKKQDYPINWIEIQNLIASSQRPLLLIGGGCEGYTQIVNEFISYCKIPYVTSLIGRGIADESVPEYVGMIGSYGNRNANIVVSQCDLLISLGSRLDTRQTGAKLNSFIPDGMIIQVDIDQNELQYNRLQNRFPVYSSVVCFIKDFIKKEIRIECPSRWLEWVHKIDAEYNQTKEIDRFIENKAPYSFFDTFNHVSKENAIITADIGQNQMWAAQTLKFKKGQKFFTSGGLAPMGFSLPAAIGAAFANPGKTIYCLNGDGGLHMALQSLLLISQYNLDIKVIVLDNKSLGMITQFQQLYFNNRLAATNEESGYLTPKLPDLAKAYFLPYYELNIDNLNESKLKEILNNSKYLLLEYRIEGLTTVSPKLEYDHPIYDPYPHLSEEELNKIIKF